MFNSKKSLKLKQNGYDDYIAAKSSDIFDYAKNYLAFTFHNGNAGFIHHVKKLLEKKNISIISKKEKSKFHLDINKDKYNFEQINIPLHLIYFTCKQFPYDYLTDYSDSPVFRVSSPGHYSKQTFNKESYICVELPDPKKKYSEIQAKNIAENYVNKYCKANYLYYLYSKNSYPIFKISDKPVSNKLFNFFLYSKNNIMDNIDDIVKNF